MVSAFRCWVGLRPASACSTGPGQGGSACCRALEACGDVGWRVVEEVEELGQSVAVETFRYEAICAKYILDELWRSTFLDLWGFSPEIVLR